MVRKEPAHKRDLIGLTMLIGLLVLAVVVGLLFTLATRDSTLIKSVIFYWLVTALFLGLMATYLFKGEMLIPRSRMMLPLGVYICLCVISMLLSRYRYAGAQELIGVVCCAMLLFVTVTAVRSEGAFLLVAGAVGAVAALSCLYGILQHYGVDFVLGEGVQWPEEGRVFSTMGHPNFFGTFLILTLPVLLGLFHWSENGLVKGLLMALICAVTLCLLYTQSRGAWLGYLGALPVWFLLCVGKRRWRLILLGPTVTIAGGMFALLLLEGAREYVIIWALPFWLTAVVVFQLASPERRSGFGGKVGWGALLLGAVVLASNLLVDRKEVGGRMKAAFETERGSVRTRKILWAGTLKMFKAKPVFGWGVGTFSIYFPRFRDPATAGKVMPNTLHAHSEYLEIGAEMGVLGLGAFLWMLAAFAWESIRRIGQARDSLQRMAIVSLLAGCTAILLQAVVSVTTRWIVGRFFLWLGVGLTIAVARMSGTRHREKKGGRHENAVEEPERFYRIRIRKARAPAARAALFLLFAGAIVAAGWWGKRVWDSAVLTSEGEHNQVSADKITAGRWSGAGIVEALNEAETLRERAVKLYERAVELNPYNLSAYYKLGHCYNLQGKLERSLATYRRMAELAPDGSDVHFNLGVVYANMGRWENSRREYEAALGMKIGPLARLGLARAYENLGLLEKAEEQYEALLKASPDDVRGLNGLASVYLRRGENRKALKLYGKVVKIDPEDVDSRLGAGLIYRAMGDTLREKGERARALEYYNKSIAELQAAARKRPAKVPVRAALALVYGRVGRFGDGLDQLRTALEIMPRDPLAHLNRGKLYRMMGESEKAAEEFHKTMEIDRKGPWGVEARRELRRLSTE